MSTKTATAEKSDPAKESLARFSVNSSSTPTSSPASDFSSVQQGAGNLAVQQLFRSGIIRAKLSISQPNDPDEQEADEVADRIMRMPEPSLAAPCPACSAGEAPCPKCAEHPSSQIHRKANGSARFHQPSAASHVIGNLGAGHPLDKSTRDFFEPRFHQDFSEVRLHADERVADQSTRDVNARAYTVGQNIVFGLGRFAPGTHEGRRLIAHELTHVVQQQPLIQRKDEAPQGRAPAEKMGASRPVDPGVGEGIDVTFILTSAPGDAKREKDFIEGMTSYVKNVLRAGDVYDVKGVEEMFEKLDDLGKYDNKKVRRIRIVGHGFETAHGGEVLTRDLETETGKSSLIAPKTVREFAKRTENRDIIKRVMQPGAVIEFWGCNLGKYKKAGKAWADLFQSTFVATKEKVVAREQYFHFIGPDGKRRRAYSSEEVDQAGPEVTARFNQRLLRFYERLVGAGEIAKVSDDPEAKLAHMRDMFDRSSGAISYMVLQEAEGQQRFITPKDLPAWNQAWVLFPVAKEDAPAPAQDKPAPTGQEQPVSPPTPQLEQPAAPPVVSSEAPTSATLIPEQPVLDQPAPSVAVPVQRPEAGPLVPPPELVPHPSITPFRSSATDPTPQDEQQAATSDLRSSQQPLTGTAGIAKPTDKPIRREQKRPRVEKVGPGPGHWVLWDFAIGGATLLPEHMQALDRMAALVLSATSGAPLRIDVAGHASHTGSARLNNSLSKSRADTVVAYLTAHGIPGNKIEPAYWGYEHPWYTAETGESPHNRRVEVEIRGLSDEQKMAGEPRGVKREDLPPPRLPQPVQWTTAPRKPSGSGKLADYLPGYSIEGKIPIRLPDVWLGTDWILSSEAELGLALEFTSNVPVTAVMELKKGKWDHQIKHAFGGDFDITGSVTEGKLSVQFKGVWLQPELEVGIANLLRHPETIAAQLAKDPSKLFKIASLEFTLPFERESAEIELGAKIPALAGFSVQLKFTPKVIVSIAPSPLLIAKLGVRLGARLGPGGAIVAGAVIAAGALTLLSLYLINEAKKRGRHWAEVANLRRGYSWRLAAEVADWRAGRGVVDHRGWDLARTEISNWRFKTVPKSEIVRRGEASAAQAYSQVYDGWQAADVMLKRLSSEQYDAAMQALRAAHGGDVKKVYEAIFKRIGGPSNDEIAIPPDPTLLQ